MNYKEIIHQLQRIDCAKLIIYSICPVLTIFIGLIVVQSGSTLLGYLDSEKIIDSTKQLIGFIALMSGVIITFIGWAWLDIRLACSNLIKEDKL